MWTRRLRFGLVLLDGGWICLSVYIAYLFRLTHNFNDRYTDQMLEYMAVSLVTCLSSLLIFRLYSRMWRYASLGEALIIVVALTTANIFSYFIVTFWSTQKVPLYAALNAFESMVMSIGLSRFVWRFRSRKNARAQNGTAAPTLIVGAGACGRLIVQELKINPSLQMKPIGFIDDHAAIHGYRLLGIPVFGGRERIADICQKHKVTDIIICMPSVPASVTKELINICKTTHCHIKIIPKLNDVIRGKISARTIRDVQISDLLGREPVHVDLKGIAGYIDGKTILVTGAGGSIGSELCRQIIQFGPQKLLLLGHGEHSIYLIEKELVKRNLSTAIVPLIADIKDRQTLESIFVNYRPEVVFHAAAYKHVPLMEAHPEAAVRNNVFGTKNLVECAHHYKAERFVLISTDKAVNPANIMGATKRIAELIVQDMQQRSETSFASVRFGNVLGSRGSVIPLFQEQIAAGGPVTITHPDMIRYFMTTEEAAQLVVQAGAYAGEAALFLLDMGKPVAIRDLARDLIQLSGYEPEVDIPIVYSGIRPGEKLAEEIWSEDEIASATHHERIYIGRIREPADKSLAFHLRKLEKDLRENPEQIRETLQLLLPTFKQASND